MKITPVLLVVLLFAACNSKPAAENKQATSGSVPAETPVDPHFKAFIGKFRMLQLPLTIKFTSTADYENLPQLQGADSNYVKCCEGFGTEGRYAYGLLPDTANNYKIIWLLPADEEVPMLTTLTKQGVLISEDNIGVGGCGPDCCFDCNETVIVNKDLSVYSADSIKECKCDDNGPDTTTIRNYARVKTAKIGADGKFKFTEIKEVKYQ
ncbi:hypothetical protein A4D02_32425 [Niastella koreensis]|uniref:Lipoprotein n=2 Tax=Niastella koreensis TaxID=354356 RepID=G8TC16_NIAKG|nr:hypothetical protein [Niastella koreensis]AEV99309.1 hypothetical protein Niako_2979 [Niastella koreensis GR20-10]OQP46096.1 hypothetical protein A4D02_32425 [Niastella koreensis]